MHKKKTTRKLFLVNDQRQTKAEEDGVVMEGEVVIINQDSEKSTPATLGDRVWRVWQLVCGRTTKECGWY